MLRELHITDLGVIRDLDVELHPGLNVLTGETGAGKTLVTVGLALATGARASAQLVRAGATAAKVQARFDAPAGADDWVEDDEVILARMVGADGKSAARVSGQLATAAALDDLGARLVEVHGQHQSLCLLEAATQTAFVDRVAGEAHLTALAEYRDIFEGLRNARRRLDELEDAGRDREREIDLLAYQVREIAEVAPRAGETGELETEEARLGHVERLLELAGAAEEVLAGDDEAAADALATAERWLDAASALDRGAHEMATRAHGLAAETAELVHDVRSYRDSLAADPTRLEEVRERRAALKSLQRKYGATDADVVAFAAEAAGRLESLSGADQHAEALRGEVTAMTQDLVARASIVSVGRRRAVETLVSTLGDEIRDLGMPTATIHICLEELPEPGPLGAERAEILFSPGTGQAALPLAKAASGGELSRVMLACRSVLADLDDVPTIVFDEVDAGIGGQAGLAVGRRLAALAETRQVLVVTHLPQIACFADLHLQVRKDAGEATVTPLGDRERVRELSRMLAGLEASTHAVSHAEELLAEAAKVRAGR